MAINNPSSANLICYYIRVALQISLVEINLINFLTPMAISIEYLTAKFKCLYGCYSSRDIQVRSRNCNWFFGIPPSAMMITDFIFYTMFRSNHGKKKRFLLLWLARILCPRNDSIKSSDKLFLRTKFLMKKIISGKIAEFRKSHLNAKIQNCTVFLKFKKKLSCASPEKFGSCACWHFKILESITFPLITINKYNIIT